MFDLKHFRSTDLSLEGISFILGGGGGGGGGGQGARIMSGCGECSIIFIPFN